MTAITDYITPNIVLFMLAGTFLVISFKDAAWLLFRAIIFVAGVLLCAATGIFSVNFMLLGLTAPPALQWYDMGTLMYFARFTFGSMVIFAQVKGFITWQRGQGGKWLCIGATLLSVFMSVYTFHADISRSMVKAAQSNIKGSVKYKTLIEELDRLKELRDGVAEEKETRIADLKANPRNYTLQEDKERKYFDEQITGYNRQIETLVDELDSYEKQKEKGGVVVSTKSTFAGIARDVVFFFNLNAAFWQPRLEMMLQYLMIAGLSLLADCAAMSFIFFGLGLFDEVRQQERRRVSVWLLQLRPAAHRILEAGARDVREILRGVLALIRARVDASRFGHDAPLSVASDAVFKALDASGDASLRSDVLPELIEKSGDASGDDVSPDFSKAIPEVKVDGVTVRGFDDVETAKKFMIDVYQKKDSYRAVYNEVGISPNTSSARMLKAVLDEAGVPHMGKKKKVNGKSRSFKKSLLRPVAEAGSLA